MNLENTIKWASIYITGVPGEREKTAVTTKRHTFKHPMSQWYHKGNQKILRDELKQKHNMAKSNGI